MEKVIPPRERRITKPSNGEAVRYEKPKQDESRIKTVQVELPMDTGELVGGYIRELHISNLTRQEDETIRRLFQALRSHNIELAPYKPVASKADAVRWLLDQLTNAVS